MLPLLADRAPWGWVRIDLYSPEDLRGHFLRAADWNAPLRVEDRPIRHAHGFTHSHALTSDSGNSAAPERARHGIAPGLTPADHTHAGNVLLETDTGEAEHLPEFVEVYLIIKR